MPMSHDLLEEWGAGDLQFTCRMCAFVDGSYSARKALDRYVCLLYNKVNTRHNVDIYILERLCFFCVYAAGGVKERGGV